MKKIFNLLLITVCMFGFVTVANAEESWSIIESEATFVGDLLAGKSVEGNEAATEFFNKYDVYYKYEKIDDTLYSNYVSDLTEGTSTGALDSINTLIGPVNSADDLQSWNQMNTKSIDYSGVEYTEGQKVGYIVALAAVPKDNTSNIYVLRSIYEVTGSSSLGSSYEINCEEDVTTDNNGNGDTIVDTTTGEVTETVTEENPNTGISDYAIYLVPLALIGGVVLMMRKNYA